MKVALCVGHSRKGDMGAVSVSGESEWHFNRHLAKKIKWHLVQLGFDADDILVIRCYAGDSYQAAMKDAAKQVKLFGADLAIELHFNAGSPSAKGFEHLFWKRSTASEKLAAFILQAQSEAFPESVNRGVKPRTLTSRGAGFLRKTHCPAVIVEPFFGTNAEEWERYTSESGSNDLAACIAKGIDRYSGKKNNPLLVRIEQMERELAEMKKGILSA